MNLRALFPALLLAGCVAAPPAPSPAPPPPVAAIPPGGALGALNLPGTAPVTTRDVAPPGGGPTTPVSLLAIPDNVFFDFGVPVPRPDAAPALAALAAAINREPAPLVLTVAGNTDAVGSDAYNQALSLERAQNVVAALVTRGVPAARLQAVGFGRTRPVASNATDEGRARNRRVELALSSSFAANGAALAALVPPETNVAQAVEPDATAPPRPTLARTPAALAIHANTPERVQPNALGPNLSY